MRRGCERELKLEMDGVKAAVSGTVQTVTEREDGSVMILLEQCTVEKESSPLGQEQDLSGVINLDRLQVYLDGTGRQDSGVKKIDLPGTDAPTICPGNQVHMTGTICAYDTACNPGEFDYQLYYRSLKLNYRMFAERYQILDGRKNRYRTGLWRLGRWASGILERTADPKESGIYQAVLLGNKNEMDPSVGNMYQKNGIAHLLAVSGLHLSLVSMAAYGSLRKLGVGYGKSGILGGAVLISYAVLTGAAPSVRRALIMGLCGFLAAYFGKTYDLMSALLLSALCMFWDSPYLLCQAGVQLSFGALVGIGCLSPCLMPYLTEHMPAGQQALLVSISMQLVTLPPLLYHFYQYPLYGIFLNFLVVPLMGGVIASGTAGIVLGAINWTAGRFALGSGHWILCWYEVCCRLFEKLPFSVLIPGRPAAWKIGVYYGVLFVTVWQITRENGAQKRKMTSLLLILPAMALLMFPDPVRGLEVTFLDVGQGDGICIRSAKETILIDGGSSDEKRLGENRLVPFLKSQGITEITYAVVSHGDQDHISGLQYLLEEESDIQVENLVLPAVGRGDGIYGELEELAVRRGSDVIWMEQGQELALKKFSVSCLYPAANRETENSSSAFTVPEDRNTHSLVLRVDYGNFHMLLTGDMTGDGEQELLGELPLNSLSDIQVLKAAHHGSGYSTTPEWLEAVRPQWTVISYGEGNRYGHPHEEVIEQLAERNIQIFETAKSGAVTLRTDGKKIRWEEYRKLDRHQK